MAYGSTSTVRQRRIACRVGGPDGSEVAARGVGGTKRWYRVQCWKSGSGGHQGASTVAYLYFIGQIVRSMMSRSQSFLGNHRSECWATCSYSSVDYKPSSPTRAKIYTLLTLGGIQSEQCIVDHISVRRLRTFQLFFL